MSGRTLFDRLWDAHVVRDLGDGWALLHVDRHLMHDLGAGPVFEQLRSRGLKVHRPELTFATPDHAVSTQPRRSAATFALGERLHRALHEGAQSAGIEFFALGEMGHGIVHVMAPELGLVLPGLSVVCTDSHTCTHGGIGALAFGIGASESAHVLATQTLRQQKPRQMRLRCEGRLAPGVTAKDLALHLIASLGAGAGVGHAIEFSGSAIDALEVEGRLTLCNLAVELGARFGLVAPDEKTIEWCRARPRAPRGEALARAEACWRALRSDENAVFDAEHTFDAAEVAPMVSWGTSPAHAIPISGRNPDPGMRPAQAAEWSAALDYMGLQANAPIAGTPVDWVFIGSCANARLSDLRMAAGLARGRRVAAGVSAWVVPGSEAVKRAAEAEGLHRVFIEAGFAWREPGCSMCVAANGERVPSRQRAVSTSNRNFVGRQGPGARTHLASPATAAACAIAGCIADPRRLEPA